MVDTAGVEAFVEPFSVCPIEVLGAELLELDVAELGRDPLDLGSVAPDGGGGPIAMMWSSHLLRYSLNEVDETTTA